MGTDIHLWTETKGDDGIWRLVTEERFPDTYCEDVLTCHPYIGRNYDLFAILADVRNGRGFAGVQTGEGFVPISLPRGLPEDLTEESRAEMDPDWGHSHSWLTLKELLDYPGWDWTTTQYGVVSEEQYRQILAGGEIGSYSGSIWGHKVMTLSPEAYQEMQADPSLRDPTKEYYVRHSWTETYKQAANVFYSKVIPRLRELGDPESVRLIFYFDS